MSSILLHIEKESFQWNINRPLADSTGRIVNMFEHGVGGGAVKLGPSLASLNMSLSGCSAGGLVSVW